MSVLHTPYKKAPSVWRRGVLLSLAVVLCSLLMESLFFSLGRASENPLLYQPIAEKKELADRQVYQNPLVSVVLLPLSFYASVLSRVDGDRCPSHPSCSLYAWQAVTYHGPLMGLWMTVDRLIHERTEIQRGRFIYYQEGVGQGGMGRVVDTLDDNDFWLRNR